MYNEVRKRQCKENDHDIREHVDWMTRYSDQAWRALERRVKKMEARLKAISVSEDSFTAFKALFREIEKNNHEKTEYLKKNVTKLTSQQSQMYRDLGDMKNKNKKQFQQVKRFINEKFSQCKEQIQKEIRDDLKPLMNDRISEIRREVNQKQQKFQNLKKDITNMKNQQDRFEKQILLKTDQTQINQSIKKLTEKLRKVEKGEKSAREELEKRVNLRIKEETEAKEILSNKVADMKEKNEGVQKYLQKMMEEQKKRELEKQVDMETPHKSRFLIQANNITLQKQGDCRYQVLLEVQAKTSSFTLHVHINKTERGRILIGVVDRRTQHLAKSSWNSANAVGYDGNSGLIFYANNGELEDTDTGIELRGGEQLRMEVELKKDMVTFITAGQKFIVHSDILSQSRRQFVPYFEMEDEGDSVQWRVE